MEQIACLSQNIEEIIHFININYHSTQFYRFIS